MRLGGCLSSTIHHFKHLESQAYPAQCGSLVWATEMVALGTMTAIERTRAVATTTIALRMRSATEWRRPAVL